MKDSRVVVVTGASAGVGRAVALAFASHGASIGLLARGRAGLAAAQHDVEAAGGRAIALPTDVADPNQVEAAAAAVEATFGAIDVWVNNAMASVFSPVSAMTPDEFRRVTEVTYLGVVYGTLSALRRMAPRNNGSIVQVGSALAYRGIPLQSAYCAAKHAIQGFCDSLWSELLHDRSAVRMTLVHLPAMNTPQFDWVTSRLPRRAQPVPPIYSPKMAAEAIVWASEHDRRELYVGLTTAAAIAGDKMFPALGDWCLSRFAYESQQTDEPEDPNRPGNLWNAADDDRDFGMCGRFGDRTRAAPWQLWLAEHGRSLAALTGALAVMIGVAGRARRRSAAAAGSARLAHDATA